PAPGGTESGPAPGGTESGEPSDVFAECFPGDERACHGEGSAEAVPACNRGTERCGADGRWSGTCEGWTRPAEDPCDSPVPECTPGDVESCYDGPEGADNVPACNLGSRICGDSGWGACQGWTRPSDNPCEGPGPGCEGVTWTRAVVPNESAPNQNESHGAYNAFLVGNLESWGLTVTRRGTVQLADLSSADVAIFDYFRASTDFGDSPGTVRSWMEAGGILVLFGTRLGTDCRSANDMLLNTGIRWTACDGSMAYPPVAAYPGHPLTDGLPAGSWPHTFGNRVRVTPGSDAAIVVRTNPSIEAQRGDIVAAQRIGCGGLVVISDRSLSGPSSAGIHAAFWSRILDWGSGAL
ncbi:MAG: hypothetical protein EA398_16955, partial [Deltaproteobacteria bacterium]